MKTKYNYLRGSDVEFTIFKRFEKVGNIYNVTSISFQNIVNYSSESFEHSEKIFNGKLFDFENTTKENFDKAFQTQLDFFKKLRK